MFVPSLEAARITISLLEKYNNEESIEDALKPDYNYVPPEDFLEKFFAQNQYCGEVQDLVAEFFFRISKYRKYLSMIVKKLFIQKITRELMKSDEFSLYVAVSYLLVIELNHFSKSSIEDLLISLNDKRVLLLLVHFKKPSTLPKLYEWGCRIWDIEYVKSVLENPIRQPLFEEVYQTVANHRLLAKKLPVKKTTVPVTPICLTRFKKRELPPSREIIFPLPTVSRTPLIKATEIPSSTYNKPEQSKKMEEARLKNRENAKKLLEFAQKKAFRCANTAKSEKFYEVREQIEKEGFAIPARKTSFRKMLKQKPKENPKKTATVILREGARLLKLEEEEIKKYEYLASGGFNIDLLTTWEEEAREKEFQEHLEGIEKKHLEGLLSYEEALITRQKFLKKKKERAEEFKKEREFWLKQLEMLRMEEQIKIQENVEKGKSFERGGREAMEQVKEKKHKIALETMEESRVLRERWLKEKEEDLQKKVQLIKEIKALQAIGAEKARQTNYTETSNVGLLYQMSIAELKERLFIMKIDLQEQLERKKAEVKMKRECRKEIIEGYQELIDSHQKIMEEHKGKLENKMKNNEKKEPKQRSLHLESLRRKLHEKRRERLKLQI